MIDLDEIEKLAEGATPWPEDPKEYPYRIGEKVFEALQARIKRLEALREAAIDVDNAFYEDKRSSGPALYILHIRLAACEPQATEGENAV